MSFLFPHPHPLVWSPGFDELSAAYPVGSISRLELKCNLKDMFLYLRLPVIKDNPYGSTRAAPLWLDLQDYVESIGTWDPPMAREDAAEWFNFLRYTTEFTGVRMNVEQLRRNGSFLIPADPVELA